MFEKQKQPDTVQEVSIPDKREYRKLGTLRPHKGQKIWEYNVKTKELKEAEFVTVDIAFGQIKVTKRINVKPDCAYVPAINKKNAMKHINNALNHTP